MNLWKDTLLEHSYYSTPTTKPIQLTHTLRNVKDTLLEPLLIVVSFTLSICKLMINGFPISKMNNNDVKKMLNPTQVIQNLNIELTDLRQPV